MNSTDDEHTEEVQRLHIPFCVPQRGPCTVSVTLQPGLDPERHGQGLVGLYDNPAIVTGYPILHAAVSSPNYRSYASLYGWIQITNTPGEPWVMDLYPLFQDLNNPFAFWGAEPTLVDAPGRQGVKNYDWTARSFLCYTPDTAMTKDVVPILAFDWGFRIQDYKPRIKRLQHRDISCWNGHLALFRSKFSGWTFEEVSVGSA